MRIAVLLETESGETRVSVTPETVKKLKTLQADGQLHVALQSSAGLKAGFTDDAYQAVGAEIFPDAASAVQGANVILKVRRPSPVEINLFPAGAAVIAIMDPHGHLEAIKAMAKQGLASFSMELMPRITRAQVMDVLSSQANLAGYRAVIEASEAFGRVLPMMMTAAGTVPAARVFVMGAGVAGLQAIATARRLGAVVTATDVRPAVKEQVESLGAKFVAVENDEFKVAETAGGYAREMSAEYQAEQAALVASHIAKQDIVITTALIPGRAAPRLISAEMIAAMQPGSVILDMAVERGGNCELSKAGDTIVTSNGVTILGPLNLPGSVPATASSLYAKNLLAFVTTLIDPKSGTLTVNLDDELVKATCLTHQGQVIHPAFQT